MHERVMASETLEHRPEDLITIFNRLFSESENTRLIWGGNEPVYIPAGEQVGYHQIIFAHGFFSSALHEISHWCIAGPERRLQLDFGYWYAADGRDSQQQAAFERLEVKPQALEWIFQRACNRRFQVSADNLNGEATDPLPFKQAVHQQVVAYCQQGLAPRAMCLLQALCQFYQSSPELDAANFHLAELG